MHSDEPRNIFVPWLWQQNTFWDDFEHVRPYTPIAPRGLLGAHGFEIIKQGFAATPAISIRNFRTYITRIYLSVMYKVSGINGSHFCADIKK